MDFSFNIFDEFWSFLRGTTKNCGFLCYDNIQDTITIFFFENITVAVSNGLLYSYL